VTEIMPLVQIDDGRVFKFSSPLGRQIPSAPSWSITQQGFSDFEPVPGLSLLLLLSSAALCQHIQSGEDSAIGHRLGFA